MPVIFPVKSRYRHQNRSADIYSQKPNYQNSGGRNYRPPKEDTRNIQNLSSLHMYAPPSTHQQPSKKKTNKITHVKKNKANANKSSSKVKVKKTKILNKISQFFKSIFSPFKKKVDY